MPTSRSDVLSVDLMVDEDHLWRFLRLLRRGFLVSTRLPCSLDRLLVEVLEIPETYATDRIQTIFLNGRAVDDIRAAKVTDGDRVALSAAMPGLVGATLRKGGKVANLRSSLSHQPYSTGIQAVLPGLVTVKLFNLVCAELGPTFLKRGVVLSGGHFREFLADSWAEMVPACREVRIDQMIAACDTLPRAMPGAEAIHLSVAAPTP
jgi:hypothetical protein